MTTPSIDEVDAMVADLLSDDGPTLEERYFEYLVMNLIVRRLRESGLSQPDIHRLCRRIDQKRQNNGE